MLATFRNSGGQQMAAIEGSPTLFPNIIRNTDNSVHSNFDVYTG